MGFDPINWDLNPLTRISRNATFSRSQYARYAGTLCSCYQKNIGAQLTLIYIYLHCVRSFSWCATTLATLARMPTKHIKIGLDLRIASEVISDINGLKLFPIHSSGTNLLFKRKKGFKPKLINFPNSSSFNLKNQRKKDVKFQMLLNWVFFVFFPNVASCLITLNLK